MDCVSRSKWPPWSSSQATDRGHRHLADPAAGQVPREAPCGRRRPARRPRRARQRSWPRTRPAGKHHTRGLSARHQLDRHDAVPAEGEEVVVDTDPVESEDLGEHGWRASCSVAVAGARERRGRRSRARAALCGRVCRPGSAAACRGRRGRPGPCGTEGCRRRAVRAAAVSRPWCRGRRGSRPAGAPCAVVADRDDRLGDARAAGQGRFDLAEFDAEAADLDLEVAAARGTPAARRPFQRARSPVRYIRSPGPPNGSATNRSAVGPGRWW